MWCSDRTCSTDMEGCLYVHNFQIFLTSWGRELWLRQVGCTTRPSAQRGQRRVWRVRSRPRVRSSSWKTWRSRWGRSESTAILKNKKNLTFRTSSGATFTSYLLNRVSTAFHPRVVFSDLVLFSLGSVHRSTMYAYMVTLKSTSLTAVTSCTRNFMWTFVGRSGTCSETSDNVS